MKFNKKKLIDLLIKKASGFFYSETQLEYEKNQKLSKNVFEGSASFSPTEAIKVSKKKSSNSTAKCLENQISFDTVIGESASISGKIGSSSGGKKNSDACDFVFAGQNSNSKSGAKESENLFNKVVRISGNDDYDKFLSSCDSSDLQLVKKKVSTHFVPPDMVAIKMLLEIIDEKGDADDIEKITDAELINLKRKLLEELKDEDF